jgi:hypothetical protein
LFLRDPVVASLIQDILATRDELEHNSALGRRADDPARKAARKRFDQLNTTYQNLWNKGYPELRRQVTGGSSKEDAPAPE